MTIETTKFVRKPFEVEAVQVTPENMSEVAEWCGGEIVEADGSKHIAINDPNARSKRQTKAFPKDWVLAMSGGHKIYPDKAFRKSFDATEETVIIGGEPKVVLEEPAAGIEESGHLDAEPVELKASDPNDGPAIEHTYRDAQTGEYVTAEYAAKNQSTTVRETVDTEGPDV